MTFEVKYATDEQKEHIRKWFGSYNEFPPGWTEVSPAEFAKSQMMGRVYYLEYRQMHKPENLRMPSKFGRTEAYTRATLFFTGEDRGFALVARYWEEETRIFKFDCLPKLKEFFEQLPVVSDSGWDMLSSSTPSRGIRDYGRAIRFDRELAGDELDVVVRYLARDNCPCWTGVHARPQGNSSYYFTTTRRWPCT